MSFPRRWDLDSIFPGGLSSPALTDKYSALEQGITGFSDAIVALSTSDSPLTTDDLVKLSDLGQSVASDLVTVDAFVNAVASADYGNSEIGKHAEICGKLQVQYQQSLNRFKKFLAEIPAAHFATLVSDPRLQPIAFRLREFRDQARNLLDESSEALIDSLGLDGLVGWSNHYETIAAGLKLDYTDSTGQVRTLSAGQALNLSQAAPSAHDRAAIMTEFEKMWGSVEHLAADTLNHLAGARLTSQRAHQRQSYLDEPLEVCRMTPRTLATMWEVVGANREMFQPYFERKKQLLSLQRIGWQDQVAPIGALGDYQPAEIPFQQAADRVIANFTRFSPQMGQFARTALENAWVESENRPGKQPGAYMAQFPDRQQPRIFLTFTGTLSDQSTLAHELGHGFHSVQLQELPAWCQDYPMNLAETASTFAELVMADGNLQTAHSAPEKIALLDAKMDNAVAMFCNIRARFLFENAFYQARRQGFVPAEQLSEIMLDAQKQAFGNLLDDFHPHFWCSKLHFYLSDVAFYNFPYTFGYLFSLGIFAAAQAHGPGFEQRYIALLQDSNNMTAEELALKHLQADLTQPDFWQSGANLISQDIHQFLKLTDPYL